MGARKAKKFITFALAPFGFYFADRQSSEASLALLQQSKVFTLPIGKAAKQGKNRSKSKSFGCSKS
jgi:hypothetical protein